MLLNKNELAYFICFYLFKDRNSSDTIVIKENQRFELIRNMDSDNAMFDVKQYKLVNDYFNVNNDFSLITWSHAVNSRKELVEALEGEQKKNLNPSSSLIKQFFD